MKAGTEQGSGLPEWDKLALEHMKRRPNPDGSLGVMLHDGVAAVAWYDYFQVNGMPNKAANLRYRVKTGGTYMVPALYPWQYDTAYPRREYDRTAFNEPVENDPATKARVAAAFEQLARSLKGSGQADRFSMDVFQRYCKSRKPGEKIDVKSKEYRDFCNALLGE